MQKIEITNLTKKAPPITKRRLSKICELSLPKDFEISILFVGKKISQKINKESRGKDYPTNILSFPYTKKEGELVLNLDSLKNDAKELGFKSVKDVACFLLVHGCLHLIGLDHGKKMEQKEDLILKALKIRQPDL